MCQFLYFVGIQVVRNNDHFYLDIFKMYLCFEIQSSILTDLDQSHLTTIVTKVGTVIYLCWKGVEKEVQKVVEICITRKGVDRFDAR